jgi:hypothetical protein
LRAATLTTPEDQAKMLGKPGTAPTTVEELTHAVHVYVVHLASIVGLNGDHQRWVRLIGEILNDKYVESSLTTSQIIDIFWTIFRDARFFFDHTDTGAYSQLARLAADLERRQIGSYLEVPHSQLAGRPQRHEPSSDRKHQREREDRAETPPSGALKR